MKKSDLIAEVAKKTGLPQTKSNEFLNAVLDIITESLKSGDKVTLTGFGTFEVRNRAARIVTDIRTKEKRQTPASKYAAFSSGAVLKAAVKPPVKAAKTAGKAKAATSKTAKATAKAVPAKSTPAAASKAAPAKATPAKSTTKPAAKPVAKGKGK